MNDTENPIVVIDDTPANLHLLSNLLKENGYKVRAFPSGKLALAVIQQSSPSLILLDIQMPQMDGYEVCQHLKANELTCDIPVIFISALDETMDKLKAFTVGGVDYITKPFQAEEVLARISTHLELSRLQKLLKQENYQQAQQLAEQNSQLQQMNQALEKANQELKQQYYQLQQAQLQVIQSEKMSALGNLVAGVAHEINNPIGFIYGNLDQARQALQDLIEHLKLYGSRAPATDINNHAEEIELEYLMEDMPKMIESMKVGCERIKDISISLRTFSRADRKHPVKANLHEGIDSTILILKHRLKADEFRPAIEVITDYGEIPEIECFLGQLNQVFMNILGNAIDAIEESNQGRTFADIKTEPNRITIKTELSSDRQSVLIRFSDNGIGMKDEVKQKIFEHLFTTKAVGKGTGLGMAIARQIVEKHRGQITVNSFPGEGTEFGLVLPIK
ncbi:MULTISPECIES: response regulator [unclassified Microcoleus]|uniref:response regulator n=1 Tax=unclassified Microcoleus TaxID=2642155 RepID=UPI002FD470B0